MGEEVQVHASYHNYESTDQSATLSKTHNQQLEYSPLHQLSLQIVGEKMSV